MNVDADLHDLVDDIKDEDCDKESSAGTSWSSNNSSNEEDLQRHSMNIEKTAKRAMVAAVLVLLVGAAAGASFLYLGISNAKGDMEDTFVKRSEDLGKQITGALDDYELACSWIHESSHLWRQDNMTRDQFRTVYDYISATGLEFYGKSMIGQQHTSFTLKNLFLYYASTDAFSLYLYYSFSHGMGPQCHAC
jgi:hypothetical protein